MKKFPQIVLLAAALELTFAPRFVQAQTAAYTVTDLGFLPGGYNGGVAAGVNNLGQVVGESQTVTNGGAVTNRRATLFNTSVGAAATRVDLGTLRGFSAANFINNLGQIGGLDSATFNESNPVTAFFFTDGTAQKLGAAGIVGGIDDDSQAVANSSGGPVLYTVSDTGVSGAALPLGSPSPSSASVSAINHGVAVGSFVYPDGSGGYVYYGAQWNTSVSPVTLTFVAGADTANAVTAGGLVAGTANGQLATWNTSSPGSVQTLGMLNGANMYPAGANDYPEIVGTAGDPDSTQVGFLYTAAGGIQNLNTLIGANPTASIDQATGINDWGQIAASGYYGGVPHALLLTPTAPLTRTTGSTAVDIWLFGGANYSTVPQISAIDSGFATKVNLLDGVTGNGSGDPVGRRAMSLKMVSNASPTDIVSTPVSITGMGTDPVVVQMNYNPNAAASYYGSANNARLCCYHTNGWAYNAVDDNTGGAASFVNGAYSSAYFQLGRYGIDTVKHNVWAVVNHAGTFGAAMDPVALKTLKSFAYTAASATLTINGIRKYTYQLQRATTLPGTYSNLGSKLTGVTGNTLSFTDNAPPSGIAFYRLVIGP